MVKTAFLFNGVGTKPEKLRDYIPLNYQGRFDKYISEIFNQYGLDTDLKKNSYCDCMVASSLISAIADRVMYEAFLEKGIVPDIGCGYSLGIINVCSCFGAITFNDSYKIIQKNNDLAKRITNDNKSLDMGIIIGLDSDTIFSMIRQSGEEGKVVIGSINSKICSMVSGESSEVEKILEYATNEGALKAIKMNIGISYHNPLLEKYAVELIDVVDRIPFEKPKYPIMSVFDQKLLESSADLIRENKINTYTPMRWDLSLDKLCEMGVTQFIDVSPNGAIKKFSRLKNRKAKIYTYEEV